jgi:hypothetical protein
LKDVNTNYLYRFSWGLGSIIALALEDEGGAGVRPTTLQDWPSTELPWAVFWMKELFVWGTLDPVAAYLLAKDKVATRIEAETEAKRYYSSRPDFVSADEVLNAAEIRNWAERNYPKASTREHRPPTEVKANLLRDFSTAECIKWRVLPTVTREELLWTDPAGFVLARSDLISPWTDDWIHQFDFVLDSSRSVVVSSPYVTH